MIKFYAPWCGHCKALKPEYERAAQIIKENSLPYFLAEIDSTKNPNSTEQYHIDGFPILKLFYQGKIIEFEGERSAESIIAFITKKVNPISREILSVEELEKVKNMKGVYCVLVYKEKSDLEKYMSLAENLTECSFLHSKSEIIGKSLGEITKFPTIVIIKDFDERIVKYEGDIGKAGELIEKQSIPLVEPFSERAAGKFFGNTGKYGAFLIRDSELASSLKIDEEFKKAAQIIGKSGEMLFFISNLNKSQAEMELTTFLSLEISSLPTIEILYNSKGETYRYHFTGEFTENQILDFIHKAKAGKSERFYKSEPAPIENSGPLFKAVQSTFTHEVLENDMDVIVLFNSQTTKKGIAISTMYKTLAESLEHNAKLKFVEIDGNKNEIPGKPIGQLPTIILFRGNDKKNGVQYEGIIREEGISKFLKNNAFYEVDIPKLRSAEDKEKNKEEL